jgi:hypothetical protein
MILDDDDDVDVAPLRQSVPKRMTGAEVPSWWQAAPRDGFTQLGAARTALSQWRKEAQVYQRFVLD